MLGSFMILSALGVSFLAHYSHLHLPYQIFIAVIGFLFIILGTIGLKSQFANILISVLSILFTIGGIEGVLLVRRYVTPNPPNLGDMLIDDPILGQRIQPLRGDIDVNGWRNLSVPTKADIVVLGDSQTYGVNADVDETWPAQLAQILDKDVYNMSLNGYGPPQYEALIEEALTHSPDIILIGLYFGNDIADSYQYTYDLEYFESRRLPTLTLLDRKEFSSVIDTVGINTIASLYTDLPESSPDFQYILGLFQHETSIGQLIFGLQNPIAIQAQDSQVIDETIKLTEQYPRLLDYYYNNNIFTIFTPAYRLAVQDFNFAFIREGQRLTLEIIANIQDKLKSTTTDLYFILIPTKEFVFRKAVSNRTNSNLTYQALIQAETRMREVIINFLDQRNIAYIDTASCLEMAIVEDKEIYPRNFDGHPIPSGYRSIAECVAEYFGIHP
ncbi:hypothetical protein GC194_10895 [bacterium]|nr:hypothetical protein [bacterium]